MPKKQSTSVTKKEGKLSTAAKVEEAIQSPKKGKKSATDSNLTPQKHREEKNDSIARLSDAFEEGHDEGVASLESKLDDEIDSSGRNDQFASAVEVHPRVQAVYKRIDSSKLGGNGTTGAIYGELTMGSMQKVLNYMVDNCGLTYHSRFIDVGSGLGKPNFHAAQDPAVRLSIGIELETIRWQLAMTNLENVLKQTVDLVHPSNGAPPAVGNPHVEVPTDARGVKKWDRIPVYGGVHFLEGDIDAASTLDPFTHIYMYDLGFPPELQKSIARKFNSSVHADYLVSYRPKHLVMESSRAALREPEKNYGYNVEYIGSMMTKMTGSGEGHTAYFYKRIRDPVDTTAAAAAAGGSSPSKKSAASSSSSSSSSSRNTLPELPETSVRITLPARNGFDEADEDIACDNAFAAAVRLANGPVDDLRDHSRATVAEFLNSGRPVRERKPRSFD